MTHGEDEYIVLQQILPLALSGFSRRFGFGLCQALSDDLIELVLPNGTRRQRFQECGECWLKRDHECRPEVLNLLLGVYSLRPTMSTQNNDDNSNSAASQSPHVLPNGIDADVAQVTKLLAQDSLNGDDEVNIAELFKRIENADGVAQGVESKLDDLLGTLDKLLQQLETKGDGDKSLTDGRHDASHDKPQSS